MASYGIEIGKSIKSKYTWPVGNNYSETSLHMYSAHICGNNIITNYL